MNEMIEYNLLIMAKEEIVHYELFLLLLQYFHKMPAADTSGCVYKWNIVKKICILYGDAIRYDQQSFIFVKIYYKKN